jgi:hypothetical protein
MPQTQAASDSQDAVDFSLTRGGPLYDLMRWFRLVRFDDHDVLRQSLAILAIGWLPLELFALFDPRAAASPQFSFWTAISIHVRYFVAIPLFFAAENVIERCCRSALVCFSEGRFVRNSENEVAKLAYAAERARGSATPELILLGAVLATHVAIWHFTARTAVVADYPDLTGPTFGMIWYALVSLPIFNFLFLRCIRQWLTWSMLLWRLSRLKLRLIPTHPDRAGGIAHLAEPTYGIALMLAAVSAVIAANWGSLVFFERISASALAVRLGTLIALGEVIALAPLVPFAGHLMRVRVEGCDPYSGFAATYARLFEWRWVTSRNQNGLLGASDISGLADLISSYRSLETLRVFPFGRTHMLVVLWAILLPMLPLSLLAFKLSLGEIMNHIVEVLMLGA